MIIVIVTQIIITVTFIIKYFMQIYVQLQIIIIHLIIAMAPATHITELNHGLFYSKLYL